MNLSRKFALGLMAFGVHAGSAVAADPAELPPVKVPAASDAAAGPPANSPVPNLVAPPTTCCPGASCHCEITCDSDGLIGGVGLYILQPYFNNNMAFGLVGTESRPAPAANARFTSRIDIEHHMEAAPLLWLGYLNDEGLGFRARWWYFRQGTEQAAVGPASGGVQVFSSAPLGLSLINAASGQGNSSMAVTSKLQLQVADFDALYEVKNCGWKVLLAGGLRLASIDQTYNAYSNADTLLSSSVFSGLGPTMAVEARHTLGCTGLSVYGNARGSILFGGASQIAYMPQRNIVARDPRDIGMPVGEGEVGIEYGRKVGCSHFFGQVGLVGQQWFGAGSASRSSVDVLPGGAFSSSAYVGDSDLAFLGLCIRLGVNY